MSRCSGYPAGAGGKSERAMRAVLCKRHGPPESLVIEDIPSPRAGKGQVVVQVKAAGVNFHDTLIIQNKYQHKPELPFSPGADIAGTVKEIGEGVQGFKEGDAVAGLLTWGGYAEEVVVPCQRLLPLPPGMPFDIAASFGCTYTTAYYALKNCARLAAGETLLVLGAAGGIGLATVDLGKAMGARVIACASSEGRLAACKAVGADEVINYGKQDLREAIRRLAEGGVDVVCDPVGGSYAEPALRCMAWKGRYLVIGFASGEIPKIPLNLVLVKGCSVHGVRRGQFIERHPAESAINGRELVSWIAAGKLSPRVSARYRLEQAGDALNDIANHRIEGKAVLVM